MSAVVALPPDHLACHGCGVAVPATSTLARIEATVLPQGPEGLPAPVHAQARQVWFTRCPSCAAVRAQAEQVVADQPRLAARLGPDSAVHRVECGLLALAAVGVTVTTAADVDDLLRCLVVVGAGVRWLARFSPALAPGAQIDTCTPAPWSHLTDDDRQACRDARAHTLRARLARSAPPRLIGPPSTSTAAPDPRGCLMCGLGAVLVPALDVERDGGPQATAQRLWRPVVTSLSALGGPPSPALLSGHLCPACASAVDAVGAVGPSAMERAVREHLGQAGGGGGGGLDAVPLLGLVGWATVPGASPNHTAWGHCDLTAVMAATATAR